jgi:hypothetical protein
MANPSKSGCGCQKQPNQPTSRQLGLDELMIVNPGPPGAAAISLGADGTLYQVQGLGQADELQGFGSFFLGEDGTLYQVQGLGPSSSTEGVGEVAGHTPSHYFLGSDGTLYELVPQGRKNST